MLELSKDLGTVGGWIDWSILIEYVLLHSGLGHEAGHLLRSLHQQEHIVMALLCCACSLSSLSRCCNYVPCLWKLLPITVWTTCSDQDSKLNSKHILCCFHTNKITVVLIYSSKCSLPLISKSLSKTTLLLIHKGIRFRDSTIYTYIYMCVWVCVCGVCSFFY